MLSVERKLKIAETVEKSGGIRTSDLSNMFNVSEMTILRDLALLEKEGLLKRVHGGAVNIKNSSAEISSKIRKNLHAKEKDIIARKASQFISGNERIFMDSSTTALALAKIITGLDNITVITNSLDIINELKDNPAIEIIFPGGQFQRSTSSFIGPAAENSLSELFADKSFISAAGISINAGITVENPVQASIKKIMMKNSLSRFILVDSSKFGNIGLSKVCPPDFSGKIITDRRPPDEYIKYFKNLKLDLIY